VIRAQRRFLWIFLLLSALHGPAFASPPPMSTSSHPVEDPDAIQLERAMRRAQRRLKRRRSGAQHPSRRPRQRVERRPAVPPAFHRRKRSPVLAPSLSVGVRLSTVTAAGPPGELSDAIAPVLTGAGFQLRGRLTPHLGTEFTLDTLWSEGREMVQTSTPLMLAVSYHLAPHRRIQPYGLVGAGVHVTNLSFPPARFHKDAVEFAMQVGAGLEVFLSRALSLHADLRGYGVVIDPQVRGPMEAQCMEATSDPSCGRLDSPDIGDKVTPGVHLSLGASFHF